MSCYEQFSLSSEIDLFFRKINSLPFSLREYSHSLIKEHLTNPEEIPEVNSEASAADLAKADSEQEDNDSLHSSEELAEPEPRAEVNGEAEDGVVIECDPLGSPEVDGASSPDAEQEPDGSDTETDPEVEENEARSSVVDVLDAEVDKEEVIYVNTKPGTHEGVECFVDESGSVPDVSHLEEVSSSHTFITKTANTRSPITAKNAKPNSILATKKAVNSGPKYQVVKRLRRSGNGRLYYENTAVPVDLNAQSAKTPGQRRKLENYPSALFQRNKGNALRGKRKDPHSRLMYNLNKTGQKFARKEPKLAYNVSKDNRFVLKNTATQPIAIMPGPNVIVSSANPVLKPGESPQVNPITGSTPVYLGSDKVLIPVNIGVNTQNVKNKLMVREVKSKPSSPQKAVSAPKSDSRYRTILPKDPAPTPVPFTISTNEVLREIQFSPNLWGKPKPVTAPSAPITVQLNSNIGSNIHMKDKPITPGRPLKARLKPELVSLTKRFIAGSNNKVPARAVRAEPQKKKQPQLSPKQRAAIAKQLASYLQSKDNDGQKNEVPDEGIVVVIDDPHNMISDEDFDRKTLIRKRPTIQVVKKKQVCDKCGKAFRTITKLRVHQKTHVPRFKCKKCDQAFFTRKENYAHSATHKLEEVHTCEFCRIEFNQFVRLKEHIRLLHPTQKLHKCQQCDYSAYTQKTLQSHVRYKHTPKQKIRELICPVCRKVYRQTSELKNHITTHLADRIFKCETCDKSFNQLTTLRSHQRNVHGERRYPCNICPMVLKTRDNQIRHMASHSDAKLFPCPRCSYACNSQGNLVKHVRTQHNIMNFSLRKREQRKAVATETNPTVERAVEKASYIANLYLNRLSKKVGKDLVSQLKEEVEAENKANASGTTENSEPVNRTSYNSDGSGSEDSQQDYAETDAAVASLDKSQYQNPFSIIPETQKMLDDLLEESSSYGVGTRTRTVPKRYQ